MDFYTTHAQRLFNQYNSLSPEAVHSAWLPHLPDLSISQSDYKSNYQSINSNHALDIGAGSGRDAAWLAAKGWNVVAVEPAAGLSRLGGSITRGQAVCWLDDSLPELASVVSRSDISPDDSAGFGFILVSAVWMHLTPVQQAQSLLRLKQLAAPGAVIVITWRNQANERERVFHPVDADQFNRLSTPCSNSGSVEITVSGDEGGRDGVVWHCAVIKMDAL